MAARRGRPRTEGPRGHVVTGAWPDVELDGDSAAGFALHVAVSAQVALDARGWSVRELARRTQLTRETLTKVLEGTRWPTLHTIVRLEEVLGLELLRWPRGASERQDEIMTTP